MLFLALLCDMFLIVCLVYFIEMVGNSRKWSVSNANKKKN
jgi:hypothetical protein